MNRNNNDSINNKKEKDCETFALMHGLLNAAHMIGRPP